jgi:hypothetical protein
MILFHSNEIDFKVYLGLVQNLMEWSAFIPRVKPTPRGRYFEHWLYFQYCMYSVKKSEFEISLLRIHCHPVLSALLATGVVIVLYYFDSDIFPEHHP